MAGSMIKYANSKIATIVPPQGHMSSRSNRVLELGEIVDLALLIRMRRGMLGLGMRQMDMDTTRSKS